MSVRPPADDPLQTCPYEISHQILKSRFQVHLVRCRRNHKDVKKVTCPFNVTHLVNEPEMNWHLSLCPNRASLDQYKYVIDNKPQNVHSDMKREEPPALHEPVECSENWDNTNAETYNPEKYASNAPILRQKIGATPSEKKAFREAERRRLKSANLK